MLTLTDSGCSYHPPQEHRFTDQTAVLVSRLVANLPENGGFHTYICEYGQTHCLILYYLEALPPKPAAGDLSGGGEPPKPGGPLSP